MDFGDILDQWDKAQKEKPKHVQRPAGSGKKLNAPSLVEKDDEEKARLAQKPQSQKQREAERAKKDEELMKQWILRYGVEDKDARAKEAEEEQLAQDMEYVRYMPAEASLDLHGMTRDEAWITMDAFITSCQKRGLRKVLIIHGKGNHSSENPILSGVVRNFIERDYRLGASGHPDKNLGGRGATWVLVRQIKEN
ncbi:MAG: Smr/MutS family protein [Treponemataceae bacterium]|nr:Smr/MutS family protein [Treponemataceae bacterium]